MHEYRLVSTSQKLKTNRFILINTSSFRFDLNIISIKYQLYFQELKCKYVHKFIIPIFLLK